MTQETQMQSEPQAEHQWLQKFVGEWTYESECSMGPGQAPQKFTGTESVRSIGGLWVVGEGRGEMPGGGTATMNNTLGYDTQKRRYVGTFIGSMMTTLWIYDGTVDPSGTVLTLSAEGPRCPGDGSPGDGSPGDGKMAKYQDVVTFKGDDRIFTSSVLGEDGQWHEFVRATYRRKK
jgi:hypothetical protein